MILHKVTQTLWTDKRCVHASLVAIKEKTYFWLYHLEWHINNERWLIICNAVKEFASLPALHLRGKWCLEGYLNITRSDQKSQEGYLLIWTAKIFPLTMTAKSIMCRWPLYRSPPENIYSQRLRVDLFIYKFTHK